MDDAPRLTPTQRLHEVTLAALSRQPVKASEEIELTRNAKGDWQFTVAGVRGDEETLEEAARRVVAVAAVIDMTHPLSRTQSIAREMTTTERGGKAPSAGS